MARIKIIYKVDELFEFLPTQESKARLHQHLSLDYHVFFKDVASYLRLGCYSFAGASGFYEQQDHIALVAYDIWRTMKSAIQQPSRIALISWYPIHEQETNLGYELHVEITPWQT